MIVMEGITKTYLRGSEKIEAVRDISIRVNKGEIFGVIGRSGAGKSTLLRCINMLEKPATGSIRVCGVEMTTLNEKQLQQERRKIGMIFQHFNLLSLSTAFANVAAPLRLAKVPRKQIEQKVDALLDLVGLSEQANAYPAQLSGGQKQRIGIARALANDPEVLLCDEATSALDPDTTASILELLLDINRKLNLTIVLVTHEMEVIKRICDNVAVMEKGSIIEQGQVIDLFLNPQTPTAKKFIGTIVDMHVPDQIMETVKKQAASGKLVRISFVGDGGTGPLLSDLALRFQIQPRILYGNIFELKNTICGSLIVELDGQRDRVAKAIEHLEGDGLKTEVVYDLGEDGRFTEKRLAAQF